MTEAPPVDVTVLTASLPERAGMLAEAVASVAAQEVRPYAHLVSIDLGRRGAPAIFNDLAELVRTEWMTFLDDDDLLDADHLSTLWANRDGFDVVYTNCRTSDPKGGVFEQYGWPYSFDLLERRSIVPITALVRTEAFFAAGGFKDEWGYDWRLWQRVAASGARVRQLTRTTWTYRMHGANQSRGEL